MSATQAPPRPRVLAVIPCLNEEAHLPGLLAQLSADPLPARIVVADGGSADRSVAIAEEAAARDPRVVVLANPKKIQSAAVNLAVATYGDEADLLIRIDAHAGYPRDFIARLSEACETTGADAVAVSMRARGRAGACFQIAAATAQNSVLGTGGSPHRAGGERKWVDHGHHALFRLEAFRGAGGYDEAFTHNEDAELDARIIAAGGRILLAADVLIDYYPRTTPAALWRQYFRFGRGRAQMLAKHKRRPKARQAAPLVVAPAVGLVALAPWIPLSAAPALVWLSACLAFGAVLGARERSLCAAASGAAAAVMHLAWSAGFWTQLLAAARAERGPEGSSIGESRPEGGRDQ